MFNSFMKTLRIQVIGQALAFILIGGIGLVGGAAEARPPCITEKSTRSLATPPKAEAVVEKGESERHSLITQAEKR